MNERRVALCSFEDGPPRCALLRLGSESGGTCLQDEEGSEPPTTSATYHASTSVEANGVVRFAWDGGATEHTIEPLLTSCAVPDRFSDPCSVERWPRD